MRNGFFQAQEFRLASGAAGARAHALGRGMTAGLSHAETTVLTASRLSEQYSAGPRLENELATQTTARTTAASMACPSFREVPYARGA
jgi:hypothetical protein